MRKPLLYALYLLHFLCEQKTKQKSRPLQAAYLLLYATHAGRKVFSLIPYSTARLSRSLTKGMMTIKALRLSACICG